MVVDDSGGETIASITTWHTAQQRQALWAAHRCEVIAAQCMKYANAVTQAQALATSIAVAGAVGIAAAAWTFGVSLGETLAAESIGAGFMVAAIAALQVTLRGCVKVLVERTAEAWVAGFAEGAITSAVFLSASEAAQGAAADNAAYTASFDTDGGGRSWRGAAHGAVTGAVDGVLLGGLFGPTMPLSTRWTKGILDPAIEGLFRATTPRRWGNPEAGHFTPGAFLPEANLEKLPYPNASRVDDPWATPNNSIVSIVRPVVVPKKGNIVWPQNISTDPRELRVEGTGFLLDEETVLTAAHVLRPSHLLDAPDLAVTRIIVPNATAPLVLPNENPWNIFHGSSYRDFSVEDISINPRYRFPGDRGQAISQWREDWALIHLPSPVSSEGRRFFSLDPDVMSRIQNGRKLALSGYPGRFNRSPLNYPPEGLLTQYQGTGEIIRSLDERSRTLATNIPIWDGHSGSPVFDPYQASSTSTIDLVGILTRSGRVEGAPSHQNFGVVLPIDREIARGIDRLRQQRR
jgi:V8-like Glu-specific endopeptidase